MLIRERAEEIISLKSKAISTVMKTQEEEKKTIASSMHEELAQGIASSIFYLNTAETQPDQTLQLLKTAKNQLKDILVDMQNLSYSITPHIVDLIPAKELVLEYATKIAATFPFLIELETVGNKNNGTADNAICSIRIIEQWLKVLEGKNDVSFVKITIRTNDHFELLIEDDSCSVSFETLEKEIHNSLVYERAYSNGGTVELSDSLRGKNLLKVRLPMAN